MKRTPIMTLAALLLAFSIASCSAEQKKPDETTITVTAPAETTVQTTEAVTENMSANTFIPSKADDYANDYTTAIGRGSASVAIVDDDKASGGKALFISGRKEAWNGADYKTDIFRGNEIEVKGSFRSANSAVKVSIQYSVRGNTSYNLIFAVNTNPDSYTSGSGKYTIPNTAERITVYI